MNVADPATLATGVISDVEGQLLDILAAGTGQVRADLLAGEHALDGSLALDSMRAVFLCSIVAATLGPGGIKKFRGNSKATDFKSIHTVASLVCRLRRAVVPA